MEKLGRRLNILQIEDNPADIALTAYAFLHGGSSHTVYVVNNGRQAMSFLRSGADQKSTPRPDLILLDMSLPGADGYEILRQIKADSALKAIPIVMFSTLDSDEVRRSCYELQANTYVVKPQDLATFVAAVQAIGSYWSFTAALPELKS